MTHDHPGVPCRKLCAYLAFVTVLLAISGLGGCATITARGEEQSGGKPHPIVVFQNKEEHLYRIGYRLAVSNAPYCDQSQPALGLLLHDARAYANTDEIRSVLGLSGDIGIQAVAPGSPAAMAGLLRNDTLVAIDGESIPTAEPSRRPDWQRATVLREKIDHSALDGRVSLTWRSMDGQLTEAGIEPVPSCTSVFELLSNNNDAAADGKRVLVGDSFPGFAYAEDELAAILAHEMAHNLLGHIRYLEQHGNGGGRVRNSERDADRLMPWLLANAGYDPGAATRMMRRFGPHHGGGLLRRRTHDGWDERVEIIAAEVERLRALTREAGGPPLDWRTHFVPLLETK